MARSPFRRAGLLFTAVLALTSLTVSAAIAAGTVSVTIDGSGSVTGERINCTRLPDAPATGTCSAFFQDVVECDPDRRPPCILLPATETLTASPLPGSRLSFAGWTGACQGALTSCHLLVTRNLATQATFRDTEPPTVSLRPTVSGTIPLRANASDNVGVARVEFRVRGALHATDTTPPFATTFDTTTVPDGTAAFTATAVDQSGNAKSRTVNMTIDN